MDSPTAITASYPATRPTCAKSRPCAWNPSLSLRASASASSPPSLDSASRVEAVASGPGVAVSIHRAGDECRESSTTPPPRLPNTAAGTSGWRLLRSHGVLRRSQCRPCPATTPSALREAMSSMTGPEAPALHRTSRDAAAGPPNDTGCHGSVRGAPDPSTSSTGARRAGARENSELGSYCGSPSSPRR